MLQQQDKEWFDHLTSSLAPEMSARIQKLMLNADQRRAALGEWKGNEEEEEEREKVSFFISLFH